MKADGSTGHNFKSIAVHGQRMPLPPSEIVARLVALNHQRAAEEA